MNDRKVVTDEVVHGVTTLLKQVVRFPEDLAIDSTRVHNSAVFIVRAAKPDFSRLIGCKGETVKALIRIVGWLCGLHDCRAHLRVNDLTPTRTVDDGRGESPFDLDQVRAGFQRLFDLCEAEVSVSPQDSVVTIINAKLPEWVTIDEETRVAFNRLAEVVGKTNQHVLLCNVES